MAAAVLETVIIPRASAFPSAVSATISSSSFSTRRSGSVGLPSSIGLKIHQTTSSSSSLSCGSKVHRRAGRIVCDAQNAAVEVPPVKDDKWQSLVLDSNLPVLVEFWAPWCGPCRMIHPVIDELAKEYAGKLKCYKVNTDESPNIATQYGIRSIPTVLIFKDGEKKNAIIGAVPKSTLSTGIENFL